MQFTLHSVSKAFGTGNGPVQALRDVSFSVGAREFVSVVGPSGCGKSTLLRIIAGLLPPSSGRVEFLRPREPGRLRTAVVFQEHGLLPWCTVLENVALGLELRGVRRTERNRRAMAFIGQMGLERFASALPHELSVGMRQRVGLARAFVADPEILLLDEPFGSLDAQTRLILREELLRIWNDHKVVVVHVTHDIEEAIMLSDRVLLMSGHPGTVLEEITVPIDRPRCQDALDRPESIRIKQHIWDVLREEVRTGLWTRR